MIFNVDKFLKQLVGKKLVNLSYGSRFGWDKGSDKVIRCVSLNDDRKCGWQIILTFDDKTWCNVDFDEDIEVEELPSCKECVKNTKIVKKF